MALGDIDGDGWCDVYVCGLETPNALFRNRGNWTFEDVTAGAGGGWRARVNCRRERLSRMSTGTVIWICW